MSTRAMTAALDGRAFVRHAWLTFAGTWAAPGTGYPSWVIQNANQDLVEEIPVQAPWSFGPIGSPDLNAASYRESVTIGVDDAVGWVWNNPLRTFGAGGYSQGGEAAALFKLELGPGGRLEAFAHNYVGGFTFGNPKRLAGHTGGGAPDPGGAGIAPQQMTAADVDANWWDEANGPANGAAGPDMYCAVPLNNAGNIIRTFYNIATNIGLGHPDVMFMAIVKGMLELFTELTGTATPAPATPAGSGAIGVLSGLLPVAGAGGGILGALTSLPTAAVPTESGPLSALGPLAGLAQPLLANLGLPDLFGQAGGVNGIGNLLGGLKIADAIEAAIIGLKFLFEGTSPHITYESTDAVPGVNHIAHAIGHVNACSAAVPARTAA